MYFAFQVCDLKGLKFFRHLLDDVLYNCAPRRGLHAETWKATAAMEGLARALYHTTELSPSRLTLGALGSLAPPLIKTSGWSTIWDALGALERAPLGGLGRVPSSAAKHCHANALLGSSWIRCQNNKKVDMNKCILHHTTTIQIAEAPQDHAAVKQLWVFADHLVPGYQPGFPPTAPQEVQG